MRRRAGKRASAPLRSLRGRCAQRARLRRRALVLGGAARRATPSSSRSAGARDAAGRGTRCPAGRAVARARSGAARGRGHLPCGDSRLHRVSRHAVALLAVPVPLAHAGRRRLPAPDGPRAHCVLRAGGATRACAWSTRCRAIPGAPPASPLSRCASAASMSSTTTRSRRTSTRRFSRAASSPRPPHRPVSARPRRPADPPIYLNHFLFGSLQTGEVASAYWPGFALLLAPFTALGIPWACNPLLASAALVLMGALAERLSGAKQARGWAMLLGLGSPAFTAMAITYFSMTAHLLLNLAFAWLVLGRTPLRLFLAGLLGAWALALHNPVPHALFALPGSYGSRSSRSRFATCCHSPRATCRSALPRLRLGPRAERGAGSDALQPLHRHGCAPAGRQLPLGMVRARAKRAGGTGGAAARDALSGADAFGAGRCRACCSSPRRAGGCSSRIAGARLLGISLVSTFAGFLFVGFDQGYGWGARYLHSAWGALPVLAAIALAADAPLRWSGSSATLSASPCCPPFSPRRCASLKSTIT